MDDAFLEFWYPEGLDLNNQLILDLEGSGLPWEVQQPPTDFELEILSCPMDTQDDQSAPAPSIGLQYPLGIATLDQIAPLLLNHYANEIIPSLTPFRHVKSPWHVTFLPQAMITMTANAMGTLSDDASLTNFYGILAISALSLYHQSDDQKWLLQATAFEQHARKKVEDVIKHALDTPKAFKYKSILMALITMVQLSVCRFLADLTRPTLTMLANGRLVEPD